MKCPFAPAQEILLEDDASDPGGGGADPLSLISVSNDTPLLPFAKPIFAHASAFFLGISTDKSPKRLYPIRFKNSGLKANPPFCDDVNSGGVFGPATTCSPSTSTSGIFPPIKLSSVLFGTYFALNKSDFTSPACE